MKRTVSQAISCGAPFRAWGVVLGSLLLLAAANGPRAIGREPVLTGELGRVIPPRAVVDPAVRQALARGARPLSVILCLKPDGDEPSLEAGTRRASNFVASRQAHFAQRAQPLLARLERAQRAGHIRRFVPLWVANAVAVTAEPAAVEELASGPEVRYIGLDRSLVLEPWLPVEARLPSAGRSGKPAWNIQAIQADRVWRVFGVDGTGTTIAVLDTGVDAHHPNLIQRYRGYRSGLFLNLGNWWCRPEDHLCGVGNSYPVDSIGHGTHVTGTAVGGDGIGVAPGARWIAARVCADSTCQLSWILEGLQWLLAPAGQSELRPDVVNLSFGNEDSDQGLVLKESTDALLAAGMIVVASAGNRPGNVTEPASYPGVIAVGAIDERGQLWPLSGYGQTLARVQKPDVVAPGVAITSTVPGGGLGMNTGTSMAAPHVSGVVALLRQAAPDLTPAAAMAILKRTATPLGRSQPDPKAGWGLVNAYAAVASVGEVGFLKGRVLRLDETPIRWAQVRLASVDGESLTELTVSNDGSYELAVRPGVYSLTAEAFAFAPQTRRPIEVRARETTRVDFVLEPLSNLGQFAGRVYGRRGAARIPLAARLELAEAPPEFAVWANVDTGFSAQLPEGTYQVRIRQLGYQILTDTVRIMANTTVTRTYELAGAPRILLVDGDAWLYRPAIQSFRHALDRIGLPFDEWPIIDESAGPGRNGGPPSVGDLQRYDVVIWSHHTSSPGTVGAAEVLDEYLAADGRLFLTGQDVLCLDGGSDLASDACNRQPQRQRYVERRLRSRVVRDTADSRTVRGAPGGPLAGLDLTLNGADSFDNQLSPDVLAVNDPLTAAVIATYDGGGGAAIQTGPCGRGRAVVLGFGFEGIAGATVRAEVLRRIIHALWASAPPAAPRLQAPVSEQAGDVGDSLEYLVRVHNASTLTMTLDVRLEADRWPASLWQPEFGAPLAGPLSLAACGQTTFGVRVQVPEVPRGTRESLTVLATDRRSGLVGRVVLTSTRLAPVLLVDGDFFYESEQRYVDALRALGLAYDHQRLGVRQNRRDVPSYEVLRRYPVVVWFTGYDWRPDGSLDIASQQALAQYLSAGGRLLFSSEDYLLIRGTAPYTATRRFHSDFLGVASYLNDEGQAHQGPLRGADGSIFDGLADCYLPLRSPNEDLSDRLIPNSEARPAVLDRSGAPVGLQLDLPPFKTVFLAFDYGLLDEGCSTEMMRRSIDWFSPLHGSAIRLVGERTVFAGGDEVGLELRLHNEGPASARGIRVDWQLPFSATLLSAPVGWRMAAPDRLAWAGALAAGQWQDSLVRVRLADNMPANSRLQSRAWITDSNGLPLQRIVSWKVNAPDLSRSQKSVSSARQPAAYGDQATYSIIVRNSGTSVAHSVVVTDSLPVGLRIVADSVHVDSGHYAVLEQGRRITWRTGVAPGRVAAMSYDARIESYGGGLLRNRALIRDEFGQEVWRSADLIVGSRLPLPYLLRQSLGAR